jgi:hypothetical protein
MKEHPALHELWIHAAEVKVGIHSCVESRVTRLGLGSVSTTVMTINCPAVKVCVVVWSEEKTVGKKKTGGAATVLFSC